MRPFEGILVLDVTSVLAGPFTSYQLALLGANVIKIEPPGRGESTRWRTESDASLGKAGMSLSYLTQSSNKRSLTLDLNKPAAREVFMKLAADVDVIVENLRTGSMAKRCIGYEKVKAMNSGVVWCAITGYGQTGPKKRHAAYDSVIQAISGMMSVTGTDDSGPLKAGAAVVDYATGLAGAFAIASALFQRERTGNGQYIDVPMLDSAMILMASTITSYLNTGKVPGAHGNDAFSRTPASTTFNTADGLLAIAINEEHQYRNLLTQLGLEALLTDPRFADPALRRENRQPMSEVLQLALMKRSASEWETLLNEVGVPAARVRNVAEIMSEEQVAANGMFHRFTKTETGLDRELSVPLTPFRFAAGGAHAHTAPRRVGADTDAVLSSLGYTAADIEQMRAAGAV